MASRILDKIIGREQELLDGARTGKVDVIERLVTRKSRNTIVGSLWKTANVNCVDREGYTPLHLSALHGHRNAVEVLLHADAGANNTDNKGCTPLHLAAWKGYHEICTLLLANEQSPVSVNLQDSNGDTALHFASQHGHAEVVAALIQYNADPAIRNLKEESPLDLASQYGRLEVVQLLLKKFPDLPQKTILNQSPLHLAAKSGHRQIIEILLDAGFDINTKTDKGTALHESVLYCKVDVVRLLVERDIDIGEVDRQGMTALSIARQTEHIQKTSQDIIQIINDHLQKKDEEWRMNQMSLSTMGGKVDYVTLDRLIDPSSLMVPQPRLSTPLPPKLVTEDVYAKPNKTEKKLQSDTSNSDEDMNMPPPIPPRSESFLQEQRDVLADQTFLSTVIAPPFNNTKRHSTILPHQSSFQEEEHHKPVLPRQPSLPDIWRSDKSSPLRKDSPKLWEPKTDSPKQIKEYENVEGITRMDNEDDDLPPPPPCIGDEGSHANISKVFTSPDSVSLSEGTRTSLPKPTPKPRPAKPQRKNLRNVSPCSSPILGRSPPSNKLQAISDNRTKEEQIDKDKLDYMQMNQLQVGKGVATQGYMQMNEVNKMNSTINQKDDYIPMNEVDRKKENDEMEDYMQMKNVEKNTNLETAKKDEYMLMSGLGKKDGRNLLKHTESDDTDNYDMSGSFSRRGISEEKERNLMPSIPLPVSRADFSDSSSDDESSTSLPFENYENSEVIREKFKSSQDGVETETSDLDRKDYVLGDALPRIPPCQKDSSDEEDCVSENKSRTNFHDNMDKENKSDLPPVPKKRTESIKKGSKSNCDEENICDKKECVVMSPLTKVGMSVTDGRDSVQVTGEDFIGQEKRLSNGVDHAEAIINNIPPSEVKENKVPKPPSLEFQRKRTSKEVQPLTPTGYNQCPTPDFPPPSPNTAMQGIQEKIADIDNKRQSRDMETITEAELLRSPDQPPEGVVQDTTETLREGQNNDSCRHSHVSSEDVQEEVVMRHSMRRSSAGEAVGSVPYRRSTSSSASSSSQEDLDELGGLAGLLKGSAPGKPRRIVSQIYDNVRYRQMRAKKGKSLPPGGLTSNFDPLMEKEEDLDTKKMIDAISATRNSVTSAESDGSSFDDNEEWDQIAGILSSCGENMTEFSDLSSLEAEIDKLLKGASKIQSVGEWLEDIGMARYENMLIANGYNDTDFLGGKIVEDADLEKIGVEDIEHRKKIIEATKLLPNVKPIDSDNPPASVEQWLQSINLIEYHSTFKDHNFGTMDRVLQLWEVELDSVLGISQIGHRKRILVSLGERQPPDRQYLSLKKRMTKPEVDESLKSPFKDVNLFKDYTNVKPLTSSEEDVNSKSSSHAFPPVDSSEDEEVFKENKQGMNIRDNSIHLRPPHQSTLTSPIKEWRHPPGMLIKGCCNYTAQYLGSTLVRELSGTSSTIEGISKLKKSAEVIAKIPTIMLSISYKGVKFIDAKSKKVICDHEIGNIFCACQDADSMNFFAYITRDNVTGKHYCHVFNVRNVDHAREIILTLGEAFEVAYQMALKEKASAGAMEFERQLSQSDAEADSISISSKASISTV